MFSVRIVTTSHYLAAPIPGLDPTISEFRASNVKKVPVLRIFGSTPAGQKTCLHVHGVFPYLYVPYDGTQPTERYLRQFAASLDKALNVANRSASANQQHVYKITVVSGIPMYGYHAEEEEFLKIYLYNPNNVRKAADLMLGGAVMNKPFQPHESHIPYALQLFIDYNLYGMNFVNVAALKFREKKKDGTSYNRGKKNTSVGLLTSPTSSSSTVSSSLPENQIWHEENIPRELLLPSTVERQSVCELEVDVVAADITNKGELSSSIGANPGLAQLWEDEKQRRRDAGESSQVEPEQSQERLGVAPSESETELVKKFLEIVKEQQAFRESQSETSSLSLLGSQLERQVTREDSHSSSEGTVILDEDDGLIAVEDEGNKPIISLDSIKKVVSFSQSFTDNSQKGSQDNSVADILASLLEEAGPPPSQLASLEDQDSVLNQSSVRDEMEDKEEDEETLIMSQSLCGEDKDQGLGFEPKTLPNLLKEKYDDVVMDTDEDDCDDIDLLPQFDGASDQIPVAKKKTEETSSLSDPTNPSGMSAENTSQPCPGQGGPGRDQSQWGSGDTQGQGYPPDQVSGYPHQQGSAAVWPGQQAGGSNWQGHNQAWQQQPHRYQGWSQSQQQSPAYPQQQQMAYRPTSPFHSPQHSSFVASPNQQSPGFQTPSPSVGPHRSPFQYSGGYQSPSSNQQQGYQGQTYQSPYQSPPSNYQQSPQPYHSPSAPPQAYQSPVTYHGGQSYHSSGQIPSSYQASGYQSPASSQMYQSPTAPRPYNGGGPMHSQSPYHSPQQTYPHPYHSPGYHSQQSGWGPRRDYPGHFPTQQQQQQQTSHPNLEKSQAFHSGGTTVSQPAANASCSGILNGQQTSSHGSQAVHPNNSTTPLSPTLSAGQMREVAKASPLQQQGLVPVSQPVSTEGESGVSGGTQRTATQVSQAKPDEFKSPQAINSYASGSMANNSKKQGLYARALPPPSSGSKPAGEGAAESLDTVEGGQSSQKAESSLSSKISTLDFKPAPNSSEKPTEDTDEKIEDKASVGVDASATPMIQQLLMEESPVKKDIKQKDRDAVAMRKFMPSPNPPKPKKKAKAKSGIVGRPRSSSASSSSSSPGPPTIFNPQHLPMGSPQHMLGRTGRSQSVSLPFSGDPRMGGPGQSYGWNQQPQTQPHMHQWRQLGYPAWQQQQQQQWGGAPGSWQNYSSPPSYGNSGAPASCADGSNTLPARVQQRSFSADTAHSPFCSPGSVPQPDVQSPEQTRPGGSSWPQSAGGEVKDSSSLSSLLQLVSDVGSSSDETGWDSVVAPTLPSPQQQPNGTNKSTPTSETANQSSPSVKDFIVLETPAKSRENCASSEECDQGGEDSTSESKPVSKPSIRLGKQNRLKRMGPKLGQTNNSPSPESRPGESISPNPWYTYTFHVPTPVFKKLKFYQSAQARRQTVRVVRMHPMDARRYSLLKIGREVVRVGRLTPQDLARYNVTPPPMSQHYASRVNLDIPTGSNGDGQTGDAGSADEGSSITFDTDFPPNKVAPPSSFDASHVAASVQRAAAQVSSPKVASPGAAASQSRPSYPTAQHQMAGYSSSSSLSYAGQPSPGFRSQVDYPGYSQHQRPEQPSFPAYPNHQPMPPGTSQGRPSGFPHMYGGQKVNDQLSASPASSSLHSSVRYNSGYQSSFMNSSYPHPHQHHHHHQQPYPQQQQYYQQSFQQQQQHYQLHHQHHHPPQPYPQQQQPSATDPSSSSMEQKNEVRSPGQHGLASNIDSKGGQGHSGAHSTATTDTPTVNTWVNASLSTHHADKLANPDTRDRELRSSAALCSASHLSLGCGNSQSGSEGDVCKTGSLTAEAYQHRKRKTRRRKKRGRLSLKKKSSRIGFCDSQDGSVNSDSDKEDHPGVTSFFTQLKAPNTDEDMRTKIVLKNVKSLRLKIPRPYSECQGSTETLDLAGAEGRDPGSDSHEQLSDVPGRTPESGLCLASRGKAMRHGCRQAKLRSIYSSPRTEQGKKRQRKKKQEPLKEGVHYIIVGKFKGHQSMLVKIKPVSVSPMETVSADRFEKLAARDVIRRVILAPLPCLKADSDDSKPAAIFIPHSDCDQVNETGYYPSSAVSDSKPICELPSRSERQGKNRRKFRSAFAKSKDPLSAVQLNSSLNHSHSKNGVAGLMRVGARTNNDTTVLSTGGFFLQLREAFLQHSSSQGAAAAEDSPPVNTVFFEGIAPWQFSNFKRKLVKNLNSSRSMGYSSSSDEEEDILEEEILNQKLHPSEVHESRKSNNTLSDPTMKYLSYDTANKGSVKEIACTELDLTKPAHEFIQDKSSTLFPNKLECKNHYPVSDKINSLQTSLPMASQCEVERFIKSSKETEDAKLSSFDKSSVLAMETSIPKRTSGEKDDFLKRQMAFFEDISSNSESDNEVVKSETENGHTSPKCPPLRLCVGSNGIKILNSIGAERSKANSDGEKREPEETISLLAESVKTNCDAEEGDLDLLSASESMDHPQAEPETMLCSSDEAQHTRGLDADSDVNSQSRSRKCVVSNDVKTTKAPGLVTDAKTELTNEVETKVIFNTVEGDKKTKKAKEHLSSGCDNLVLPSQESTIPLKDRESKSDAGIINGKCKLPKRTKKRGKNRKRSVNDKGKTTGNRSTLASKESSSNDEAQPQEEKGSGFEKKRLRQRKQTSYSIYSDDLDSSEDDIWGFEKPSCSKVLPSFSNSSKNLTKGSVEEASKLSKASMSGSSRRRKGPSGGGKLLNSLSLLHMATLANLTEAQQDSLDGSQSASTPTEQYSDKASGDCSSEYTPSMETLAFISPKTSEECGVSPPVASSPSDQARRTPQSSVPRQLFQAARRRAALRPGCNGSSGLGTQPVQLSQLVSESTLTSPAPSISSQTGDPPPTPTASKSSSSSNLQHQLLETRKAQVNCASFSMRDILQLATPDDSMDSDSKDAAAVVKPPEVKRAQVRSTSLSMSDILQLTRAGSPAAEQHPLLDSAPDKVLQRDEEDQNCEASSSLLSQMAAFKDSPDASHTKFRQQGELQKPESVPGSQVDKSYKSESPGSDEKPASAGACSPSGKASVQVDGNTSYEKQINESDRNSQHHDIISPSFEALKEKDKNHTLSAPSSSTPKAMSCKEVNESLSHDSSSRRTPSASSMHCIPIVTSPVTPCTPGERDKPDFSRKCDETDGGTDKLNSSSSVVDFGSNFRLSLNKPAHTNTYSRETAHASQSSVLPASGVPEISVTCEDTACGPPAGEEKASPHLRVQARELNPLHPLEIPTYPYVAWPPVHPFPTAPASDSPMYRQHQHHHPYYWQWPTHHAPSSAMSSPLNLSTATHHRSPNSYSPITPTSPLSPYHPPQAPLFPQVHTSSLSPPAKKAKPLWYPWLGVESSRNKDPAQTQFNSKEHQQLLSPSGRMIGSRGNSLSQGKKTEHAAYAGCSIDKPPGFSHSIADLLASSPVKSAPLKINKEALSSCETVSQFLGTVIDTAYCRNTAGRHFGRKERPSSVSDHRRGPSSLHRNGEPVSDQYRNQEAMSELGKVQAHPSAPEISSRSLASALQGDAERVSVMPETREPVKPHTASPEISSRPFSGVRRGEADRVRAMLENEMALRGQLGLPPLKCHSSLSQSNRHAPREQSEPEGKNLSLTDRLVSQLIKGGEPQDGPHGRKRRAGRASGHREGGNASRNKKEQEAPGLGGPPGNSDAGSGGQGGEPRRDGQASPPHGKPRDVTLRPVACPPRRGSVEDSLRNLGLNTVQPPSAFCSNSHDLPERPMEHGGRVLKIQSNRPSDVAAFPCGEHLVGVQGWRLYSLQQPGPHSRVLAQAGGLAALEQASTHHLRSLLRLDRSLVASPAQAPPARAAVVSWLRCKMTAVLQDRGDAGDTFRQQQQQQDADLPSPAAASQGEKHKNVTFSQHPQLISPLKAATSASDLEDTRSTPRKGDCHNLASPTSFDNSTLMDTDLDISCTPTQTPRPVSQLGCSPCTLGDFAHTLPRQTKTSHSPTSSPTSSPQTLDIHFRKTKRRSQFATQGKAKGGKMSISPTAHLDLLDPSIVPIAPALPSPVFHDRPHGASHDNPGAVAEAPEHDKSPLLKRLSTNTENLMRRNVLRSQTQRQYSELGFTAAEVSQIEGPTPKNSFGFKVTQNQVQGAKAQHKYQCVTTLSLELHVETRGDLRPDPELDPIQAIFYSVLDDVPPDRGKRSVTGVILVDMESWSRVSARPQNTSADGLNLRVSQKPCSSSLTKGAGTSASTHNPDIVAGSSAKPDESHNTPLSSPRPVASQSPSPTPKKGGKGKGGGAKRGAVSPARPGQTSSRVISDQALLEKCSVGGDLEVTYARDEMHLLGTLIDLVTRFDPDILVGFEIQMLSWGFLLQRAAHLSLDLCSRIARVQDSKENNQFSATKDEWGADHMSEIHVAGRVVLNLWRIIRHEVALNVYTFENVAYHILHRRVPLYSFRSLTKWFNHRTHLHRWQVLEHYMTRVKGQLELIDNLDLIGKTSEFARVFGIEFYDVLARGSQIRVESMMLRLAKPLNYVPVSPSVNQRARQRAPECIPLTLEPESQLYTSPVVVLDFQSLYPSIMIAYNYCFSTCLGRLSCLENAHEGPFEFGCTSLKLSPATLKKIKDYVTVSPNGVVFLRSSVRRGVLPRMVKEILNTRIMVKKTMKSVKDDKTLSRMLDARQLGLKLIANVTYGYTGASFSGRMPCIEVGDSIVRKARETLERAIELVRTTPRWGAQVVYGDTDSLFIHFPGRSKDEAFVIGHEIADAVTAMFPSPMKLKFEKVYLPCVLQTKKRYVGFMYETPDQKEPVFDAKGIETVRRDSCSAVSKILERSIKVLFSTHDLSRVRHYVTRQLHKLLEGKVSILDLIFAKEFRGSMGYKPGACVPALEIARRRVRVDRRWEPRVGERVPYVVVHGPPGLPLIQLVREPHDLATDPTLRLNATYYISKQILPPLDRLFSLIGINVFKWYQDMPKVVRLSPMMGVAPSAKQGTISQFFATTDCPVCEAQTKRPVCEKCSADPQQVVWTVVTRTRAWERTYSRLMQVCATCQGTQDGGNHACVSTDCPIMFRRIIARQDLARADNLRDTLNKYLDF